MSLTVIILPQIMLGSVEAFVASGLYMAPDRRPHLAFRVQPGQVEAHQSRELRPKWRTCGRKWSATTQQGAAR